MESQNTRDSDNRTVASYSFLTDMVVGGGIVLAKGLSVSRSHRLNGSGTLHVHAYNVYSCHSCRYEPILHAQGYVILAFYRGQAVNILNS